MRFHTVQSAAKLLGVKPKLFFRFLRQHGFLSEHNLPKTLFIQKELFVIKHTTWSHPGSETRHISSRTLLTPKGVGYFDELLRQQAPQALRIRDRAAANEDRATGSAECSTQPTKTTSQSPCRNDFYQTKEKRA